LLNGVIRATNDPDNFLFNIFRLHPRQRAGFYHVLARGG
jgi:hypothetical protein